MVRSRNSSREESSTPKPPDVFADVILQAKSGKSVLKAAGEISPRNVKEFLPSRETIDEASRRLQEEGFRINLVADTHISISGPRELFEKVFRVKLTQKSAPVQGPPGKARQPYYEANKAAQIPDRLAGLVEAVNFPVPPVYFLTSTPPPLSYDHLEVPDDVARNMDAIKVHARGITGAGIKLAMVDTGFLTPLHPYYQGRGYNIQPVVADPSDPDPNGDSYGHGTGIAACALAVAPGVTFIPVKTYGGGAASFARAVQQNPHIITNSWGLAIYGWPFIDPTLQLAVNNAVADGIVVLFACGNGGLAAWPGSEPAVISVGGAFIGPDDTIQASSYASSGIMASIPGRQVPDLCGVVGLAPKGIFIALPTQAGSTVDTMFSGGTFPDGDETPANDGWVVASGTSSATPMVAGVCALLMQANPALIGDPASVRLALNNSCLDVTSGNSASGEPAGPGQDLATGHGLVQAYRAVFPNDIWMKDNPDSDVGWVPTHGRRPAWPPFAHWTSPDVKVFAAPLANPSADFDPTPAAEPIFGQDNFIYVRVRNRGLQASGAVSVRLYYADPATSMLFPADWRDGQSGIPAQGSITAAGAATNLQSFPSVAPGGCEVLPEAFVWRPPDPTTATLTQTLPDGRTTGHFCLLVRLESADDPITWPAGTQASVINDNNIGMRNVTVFSGPVNSDFFMTFFIRGAAENLELARTDLLFDLRRLPSLSTVTFAADSRKIADARPVGAERVRDRYRLKVGRRPAGFVNIALDRDEKILAKISIRFPAGTRPGPYSVPILQKLNGRPVGGLTFVSRVHAPFLRKPAAGFTKVRAQAK